MSRESIHSKERRITADSSKDWQTYEYPNDFSITDIISVLNPERYMINHLLLEDTEDGETEAAQLWMDMFFQSTKKKKWKFSFDFKTKSIKFSL